MDTIGMVSYSHSSRQFLNKLPSLRQMLVMASLDTCYRQTQPDRVFREFRIRDQDTSPWMEPSRHPNELPSQHIVPQRLVPGE